MSDTEKRNLFLDALEDDPDAAEKALRQAVDACRVLDMISGAVPNGSRVQERLAQLAKNSEAWPGLIHRNPRIGWIGRDWDEFASSINLGADLLHINGSRPREDASVQGLSLQFYNEIMALKSSNDERYREYLREWIGIQRKFEPSDWCSLAMMLPDIPCDKFKDGRSWAQNQSASDWRQVLRLKIEAMFQTTSTPSDWHTSDLFDECKKSAISTANSKGRDGDLITPADYQSSILSQILARFFTLAKT